MDEKVANRLVVEIADEVLSDNIDMDGPSLYACLAMLKHTAEHMLACQRRAHGDPCATLHFISLLENAELAIADAVDEYNADAEHYATQQGRLKAKLRSGAVLGPDFYMIEE